MTRKSKVMTLVLGMALVITVVSTTSVAKAGVADLLARLIGDKAGQVVGDAIVENLDIEGEELSLGSFAGPEITSPYLSLNGTQHYYYSSRFNKASSTLCSFKLPSATSTLVFGSSRLESGTSSTLVLDVGTAALWNATTTKVGTTYNIVANAQATIVASSTATIGDPTIFAPNLYLNWKVGGHSDLERNELEGGCKAEVIVN